MPSYCVSPVIDLSVRRLCTRPYDGTRLYCLDGVSIGSRFVEDPESTTVSHLEKMTAAQRAACFDIAPKREQVLLAIHMMEDEER